MGLWAASKRQKKLAAAVKSGEEHHE
jgi:hypothetical protein